MTERERFYMLVRMLRQKKRIRIYTHQSMYEDGWIKIYEMQGNKLGHCIVHVSDDDEDALYYRAANDIAMFLKREKQNEEKKK